MEHDNANPFWNGGFPRVQTTIEYGDRMEIFTTILVTMRMCEGDIGGAIHASIGVLQAYVVSIVFTSAMNLML